MTDARDTALALLDLSDEALSRWPDPSLNDVAYRLAGLDGFQGLALAAPRGIMLGTSERAPLTLLSRFDGHRRWEVRYPRNTNLVLSNLDQGEVRVVELFPPKKRRNPAEQPRSMEGPEPIDDDASAIYADAQRYDARELALLRWEPSRWACTVVSHDWISNTVELELTRAVLEHPTLPDGGMFVDAELARAAGRLEEGPLRMIDPECDAQGFTLRVERDASGAFEAVGTLRTVLATRSLVDAQLREEDPALPHAVVCGALFDVVKDEPDRPLLALRLPILEPVQLGQPIALGFRVSLGGAFAPEAGEHLLYGVLGAALSGPHRYFVG